MTHWLVGRVVRGIAVFVVAAMLLSLVVMLLWIALVPALFGGPSLSYVQALGLLVLSHILLRGWSRWRHSNAVGGGTAGRNVLAKSSPQ